MNEAALLAARKDQSEVHARDFSDEREILEVTGLGPPPARAAGSIQAT